MEVSHHDARLRGLRVHWVEAGQGPPLLLIHGFIVSHKEWLPALPYLAKHFRCIALDLPGFGASDKWRAGQYPYTREAFAETARLLLAELGIARAHLCGHSMGGSVAITLAADHPGVVDRLALMDTVSYDFPLPPKARLPMLPVLGPLVFKRLYRRSLFRDYFLQDVWSGHEGVDLAQVDSYYEDFNTTKGRAAAYVVLRNTLSVASLEPKIPRVRADTLVLWGADDRIFSPSLAHKLVREMPKARLEILEGVAHAPNEEQPERTADLLTAHFLAGS